MSFGGPSKPKPVPAPKSAPQRITDPGVEKTKKDLTLRLHMASSRRGSNITGMGLLAPLQEVSRPSLQPL